MAPDELLFTAPGGGVLRNPNFRSRIFERAKSDLGLGALRIHDLRHSSILLGGAGPGQLGLVATNTDGAPGLRGRARGGQRATAASGPEGRGTTAGLGRSDGHGDVGWAGARIVAMTDHLHDRVRENRWDGQRIRRVAGYLGQGGNPCGCRQGHRIYARPRIRRTATAFARCP